MTVAGAAEQVNVRPSARQRLLRSCRMAKVEEENRRAAYKHPLKALIL